MSDLSSLAQSQLQDASYLKAVTELGDEQPVVTTRDIHSTTGLKLVNAGMRFNSSLYDKLLQHKLVPSLDESLSVEDAVSPDNLAITIPAMFRREPWLRPLQQAAEDENLFNRIISRITLPPPIAFKLTVMRERSNELFRHSLALALICIHAGQRYGLKEDRLVELATAALLHDIGVLHINPGLLIKGHTLDEAERRHLHAHPLTAWLILDKAADYSEDVLSGVLQHHERIDGSGYPQGIRDDQISLTGRLLAVAEIVSSRQAQLKTSTGKLQLGAILKLNSRRLGSDLIGLFDVFYRSDSAPPAASPKCLHAISCRIDRLLDLFSRWDDLWNMYHPGYREFDSLHVRIRNLKIDALDAGLAPQSPENLAELDALTCYELHVLLDELVWQQQEILEDIQRRWPTLELESPTSCAVHISDWMKYAERTLSSCRKESQDCPTQ